MESEQKKLTVLLVDDEEEFLDGTARLLERRGVAVRTASRGKQALEQLATDPTVDVVVLDEKMPGLSGEQVFERLRRRFSLLPVIVLTGHGSIPQAFRMSKAGVVEYLVKPTDVELLEKRIRAAARARPRPTPPPALERGERIPVLLVDDDPELLAALAPVLARRGLEMVTAGSADVALAWLQQRPIDVLILDVKLPGTDGLELLRRAKQQDPSIEVVLLTGYPNVQDAVQGLGLGAVDYLGKPPDIDALVDTVQRAYRRRLENLEADQRRAVKDALEHFPG
jgi:DNA-binding NtrC family response regulator